MFTPRKIRSGPIFSGSGTWSPNSLGASVKPKTSIGEPKTGTFCLGFYRFTSPNLSCPRSPGNAGQRPGRKHSEAGDCKLITLFPLDNPSRRGHMPCRHIDAPAQAACTPRANGSKWWSRGDSEDSTRARSAERDRTAQYCLKGRDSPQHRAATDIIDLEAKLAKVRISNVEVWVHFVYNCYANEGGVDQLSVTGHLGGWEPVVKPTSQRSVFCFGAGGRMQVNRLKPCGKPRCPRLGAPSCEFCLERRPRLCERRRSSRAVSRQLRVT